MHSKETVEQTIVSRPIYGCRIDDILHGLDYVTVGGNVFMHPDIYQLMCVVDPTFAYTYDDMVCVRDWMPERTVVTYHSEPQLSPHVAYVDFQRVEYAAILRDFHLQGFQLPSREAFYSVMTDRDRLCIHPNLYTILKTKDPLFEWTVTGKVFLWSWMPENDVVFYQDGVHWDFEHPPITLTDVL